MRSKCNICGKTIYAGISFKNGYICEDCVYFIKAQAL